MQKKIYVLFLVILLFFTQTAFAKPKIPARYSLKFGTSSILFLDSNPNPRVGLQLGFFLHSPYSQSTHLILGCHYMHARAQMNNKTAKAINDQQFNVLRTINLNFSTHFIELPLVLSHTVNVSKKVNVNLYFGLALSGLLTTKKSNTEILKEEIINSNIDSIESDYSFASTDGTSSGGTSLHFGIAFFKNIPTPKYRFCIDFIYPLYNIKYIKAIYYNKRILICNLSLEFFL